MKQWLLTLLCKIRDPRLAKALNVLVLDQLYSGGWTTYASVVQHAEKSLKSCSAEMKALLRAEFTQAVQKSLSVFSAELKLQLRSKLQRLSLDHL